MPTSEATLSPSPPPSAGTFNKRRGEFAIPGFPHKLGLLLVGLDRPSRLPFTLLGILLGTLTPAFALSHRARGDRHVGSLLLGGGSVV